MLKLTMKNPLKEQAPSQSALDPMNSPQEQLNPLPLQNEAPEASQAGSTIEPDHFDDLIDAAPGAGGGGIDTPAPPGRLDKENFHKLFIGVFKVCSLGTGLKSLHVEASDDTAHAASDALYETILDIPMLHFLLEPQGKWMGRAVCIGMFVVPMTMNVQAEIAARTAKPSRPGNDGAVTIPDFDMSGKTTRQ